MSREAAIAAAAILGGGFFILLDVLRRKGAVMASREPARFSVIDNAGDLFGGGVIDLTPGEDFERIEGPSVIARLQAMPEREVVARTAWAEARGVVAGDEDLAAVISVIRNRTRRASWPSTPKAVALQRDQFSVWWDHTANTERALAVTALDRDYRAALTLYDQIIGLGDLSMVPPAARNADHYHADNVSPFWRNALTFTGRQGPHLFYTS